MITNIKNRFSINSYSVSNITPLDAYKITEQAYEILEHNFKPCEIFKIVYTFYMNPFILIHKHKLHKEAIEYLSNLRQIGRWSAEMILLFTFNRSNIWPLQDIGLLRAISNNYKKKYFPPNFFLDKLYKKFSPYCSVATWYLWRSIDNEPIQY